MKLQAWLAAGLLLTGVASCGPTQGLPEPQSLRLQAQGLDSTNGLTANGLTANGLTADGLSADGLSADDLSTETFSRWFQEDPALADMVMRYVVRCAVPAGESRSYTDAKTGSTYTWSGGLGLAPGWASGLPATLVEQRVITACLLAHLNRYGVSIPLSILGRDAEGVLIPRSPTELSTYSVREACFFGNLFTDEGLYFGVDRSIEDNNAYLTRACAGVGDADDSDDTTTECAPLSFIGPCWERCKAESTGPFYKDCTYNGVTYPPLTTRMRESDYEALFGDTLE